MKAFRWIHRILAFLNGIVVLLLLISAFSDIVSPADHLLFAYLGLAFPLFLFLNVGFFASLGHHAQMEPYLRCLMLFSDLLETDQAIPTVSFTGGATPS